jgi:hypothetical protein
MGGGSASGEIAYPAYLENVHSSWLGGSGIITTEHVQGLLKAAINSDTPYTDHTVYDPDNKISEAEAKLDAYCAEVTGTNAVTEWTNVINAIVAVLDNSTTFPTAQIIETNAFDNAAAAAENATTNPAIQQVVDTFTTRSLQRHFDAISTFSAGAVEFNAVNTSAFILGKAILEMDRVKEINNFEANLIQQTFNTGYSAAVGAIANSRSDTNRSRNIILASSMNSVIELIKFRMAQYGNAAQLLDQHKFRAIVAKTDEGEVQLKANVEDALWDFQLYQHAGNVMAAITGAATVPRGPGGAERVLSGVLGGAAVGAQVGGPIGAGVGAGIGGLISAFG